MRTALARYVPAMLAIASVACSDGPIYPRPVAPEDTLPKPPVVIPGLHQLGDVTNGEMVGGVAHVVYYRVPASTNTAVLLSSPLRGAVAYVVDTTTVTQIGLAGTVAAPGTFGSYVKASTSNRDLRVTIRDQRASLHLDTVGPAPYSVRFVAMDTVSESHADVIGFNESIIEQLSAPADADAWRFEANEGDRIVAFLRIDTTAATVVARIMRDTVTLGEITQSQPHASVHGVPSVPVVIPATGTYRLSVSWAGMYDAQADVGYRLQVLRLPEPDPTPTVVPFNSDYDAALSPYGDLDEYTFDLDDGDVIGLAIRADSAAGLQGTIRYPDGSVAAQIAWDPAAVLYRTGVINTPAGMYRLVVTRNNQTLLDSVPYTLRLFRSNRSPESLPAQIVANQMYSGESIDSIGDVDEFAFTLDETSVLTVVYWSGSEQTAGITMSYLDSAGVHIETPGHDAETGQAGSVTLAAGTYRLRAAPRESFTDSYEFILLSTPIRPEGEQGPLRLGDVVVETAAPASDRDDYQLEFGPRHRLRVGIQGLGQVPRQYSLIVSTIVPTGALSVAPTDVPSFTPRLQVSTMPALYGMSVSSRRGNAEWHEEGAFMLSVVHADTTNEVGPYILAVGDSIESAIESNNDVDRFLLTGVPGSTVQLAMTVSQAGPALEVYDDAQGKWRGTTFVAPYNLINVTIPSSGSVTVDVVERCTVTYGACPTLPIPYTVRVRAVP